MTLTPNRSYPLPTKTDLNASYDQVVAALEAIDVDVASVIATILLRATIDSPDFTGNPQAPTQAGGNASRLLATTQFVANALATFSPPNISADTIISGTLPDARLSFQISSFIRTLTVAADALAARGVLSVYSIAEMDAAIALLATKAAPTFTGAVTLGQDPVSALQAATKQYVDNLAAGLDVKPSTRAATTANITLSGAQTIDGVSVIAGDRVLVKNQTTTSQNGIYVAAAGAWARATDMDAWAEVPGAHAWVEEGTTNGDTAWVATANAGGTIGTTAITWSQFGGTGAFAPIASPTFSGTPAAPTAVPGTNTTQLATTAFTTAAVAAAAPNYGAGNAALAAGAVGTTTFAKANSTAVSFGGTTAGSNLTPIAITGGTNGAASSALSGTWMCLGHAPASNYITLFMRVS